MTPKSAADRLDAKRIDQIFAVVDQCHRPGAAVGIAIHGKPVYRKGFGLANAELPALLSPTIRMRIGSTTKHFTALAFMLLCEEAKAGLDDSIGTYLRDLHPVSGSATIRSLITHTSGLRDVFELGLVFSGAGRPIKAGQYLELYRVINHVNTPPGTTWSYNNGGYVLLTAAIEHITGQSLEDVLRTRIFEPVGMYDTMLRRRDDNFVPNSATLHMTDTSGEYSRDYMGMEIGGEGGLVSTVDDMLRWLKHMDAPIVGSAATWGAMKTPVHLSNGTSTGYGLGLMMHNYRGVATIAHAGAVLGGNSQMIKVPSAGIDIAIMVNRADVSAASMAEEILDALVANLAPAAQSVEPLTGTYIATDSGTAIELYVKNDVQMVAVDGTDASTHPDRAGSLRPATPAMAGVTIAPSTDQSFEYITYESYGRAERAKRVMPPEDDGLDEITGSYRMVDPAIMLEIRKEKGGGRIHSTGPFGAAAFAMERLAADVWRIRASGSLPIGGVVTFNRDRSRLSFSTARTINLIFDRLR